MTLLIIIVLILCLGGFFYAPRAGYTTPGYAPFSIGGLLLILLVLYLLGFIHV